MLGTHTHTHTHTNTHTCVHRNGVLLCDVAAAVTGTPLPGATSEPRDHQAAKGNILLALDHLGLLDLFDDSQLVRTQN